MYTLGLVGGFPSTSTGKVGFPPSPELPLIHKKRVVCHFSLFRLFLQGFDRFACPQGFFPQRFLGKIIHAFDFVERESPICGVVVPPHCWCDSSFESFVEALRVYACNLLIFCLPGVFEVGTIPWVATVIAFRILTVSELHQLNFDEASSPLDGP